VVLRAPDPSFPYPHFLEVSASEPAAGLREYDFRRRWTSTDRPGARLERKGNHVKRSDLPDFLVIGAMKGGTTSLYHYLSEHPQVHMSKVKEVDFFTSELNWDKGFDWYARQFADAGPTAKKGEASTSYTKFPRYSGVAPRIADHLPDAKLIYVVRDPMERIRSHYQHNVAIGEEQLPIESAIEKNPVYIDYSRYAMQLDQYLEHFPRDQVLVITSEALRSNRERTFKQVLAFIDVDPNAKVATLEREFYKTEERPAYGPIVGGARRTLKKLFPKSVGLWRGRFLPDSVKRRIGKPAAEQERITSGTLPEDSRQHIATELHADVVRLRSFVASDFDGWGIG
jgi:Sulfotransferase domain